MKLISIAVPSYNSEAYLDNCLKSLLATGSDEVEILIVNDGSKDKTAEIADRWAAEHPGNVKAIHQVNGGHGEAVNAGLRNATGLYFKVVDSDDWVDTEAFRQLLDLLRAQAAAPSPVDLVVSNFVYEKVGAKHKRVMHYRGIFETNKTLTWAETGDFALGRYLMMHSLLYRTAVLREAQLELPKHTFYVDNLYVYVPLEFVKSLYYLDVDFYRYYIGRSDQSVNEAVMIRRLEQQIKVNKLVVGHQKLASITEPKVRALKEHQLEIITAISCILLIRSKTDKDHARAQELWAFIKDHDEDLYRRLKKRFLARMTDLRGPLEVLPVLVYQVAQKVFGFN